MAELTSTQEVTFNSVLDGTALSQLQALSRSINADANAISQARADSKKYSATQIAILNQAATANSAARNQLNQAAEFHDQIAQMIQTATGSRIGIATGNLSGLGCGACGAAALATFSGLSLAPAAIAVIAVVGLVALAVALNGLAKTIAAAQGKDIDTKGYLEQLGIAAEGGSKLLGSVTTLAVVAGLGVLAYWYFKVRKAGA